MKLRSYHEVISLNTELPTKTEVIYLFCTMCKLLENFDSFMQGLHNLTRLNNLHIAFSIAGVEPHPPPPVLNLIRGGSAKWSKPLLFYLPFWQERHLFYIPFIGKAGTLLHAYFRKSSALIFM